MSRALTTPTDPALPLTDAAHETYAVERALGYSMRESVRRAGGKPENGSGTKWESNPLIQARMKHLRGLDDVAYVRFASVYRNFREAKDFETALAELSGEEAAEIARK